MRLLRNLKCLNAVIYVLIEKSSGTELIYKSDYAIRVLCSREKGRDIKAREERKNESKVHVIGKGYKNLLLFPRKK